MTRFGEYLLVRPLATGGMAEIWLAENAVGRKVVVKRIRRALADDPTFIRLFLREAEIAVTLDHANVAKTLDFGEVDGEYFLAMEFIDGQNLAAITARANKQGLALPFPVSVFVVASAARGLHYVHSATGPRGQPRGIVHRDLTPQNLMCTYSGEVKILDFGIAKDAQGQSLTRPGIARGKYLYFSPEQVRERPLDARSDIYALGVVLYELFTGQSPYAAETVGDVLRAIDRANFAPPSTRAPDLPDALEAICLKAMARRPADRYQSAAELEADLSGWLRRQAAHLDEEALAEFLGWLFRDTLEQEGRHGLARRSFPTALLAFARGGAPRKGTADEADARAAPPPRRRTLAAAGGALLLLLGVAGTWLWTQGAAPETATSMLSTLPPGARIVLDGKPTPWVTPHTLHDLDPERMYRVVFERAGHRPAHATFRGGEDVLETLPRLEAQGPTAQEIAQLEAYVNAPAEVAPRKGPAIMVEALRKPGPWGRAWGRFRRCRLDLPQLWRAPDRLRTLRVDLDPERPHSFEVAGALRPTVTATAPLASMLAPLETVLYEVSYADGRPAAWGLIGPPRHRRLRTGMGATALRLTVVDPYLQPTPFAGDLWLQEEGPEGQRIDIDPGQHVTRLRAFDPEPLPLPLSLSRRLRIEWEKGPEDGRLLWVQSGWTSLARGKAGTEDEPRLVGVLRPGGEVELAVLAEPGLVYL
ncbi:MAG: serine/threonine protein kinase, partial [Deltaproteobacteria bacterium]